jgi:hypothetical protein
MLIADGLNAKFLMTMEFSVPVNVCGGEVTGDDEHPAMRSRAMSVTMMTDRGKIRVLKFIPRTVMTRI